MRPELVLLLAFYLITGCSRTSPAVSAKDQTAASQPVVQVVRVERQDLAQELQLAAEFRPYQEVDLHAKVPGYLRTISVDIGDRVRAGQLLATLEAPEWTEQLSQASAIEKRSELDVARARGELKRAEAARELRKVSYERLAGVAKARPNLIAQAEIQDAHGRLLEADAQVATAQAALAAIEQQVHVAGASRGQIDTMLRYLRISAPFSGVITKRYADVGAMVPAGTSSSTLPVVRLSQVDRLRLVLPAPESVVPRVSLGAPVEVRVDSLGRVFHGKVTRTTGRLETSTRTMETEIDVPNPEGVLKPGMYAYANITLSHRDETLALPIQAVVSASSESSENTSQRTVFVVDQNGRVNSRLIHLGLETPEAVEVLDGLREGELVAIGGSGITAGQTVKPRLMTYKSAQRD
ncbi:MAG TPA: efflux RND transporter periplasmic adaptor subunit [Bryobacteraceae bacterium]|nr:efflux RND transporter periplasmic adaptor subunit [Bryobacteraceae bacterium]